MDREQQLFYESVFQNFTRYSQHKDFIIEPRWLDAREQSFENTLQQFLRNQLTLYLPASLLIKHKVAKAALKPKKDAQNEDGKLKNKEDDLVLKKAQNPAWWTQKPEPNEWNAPKGKSVNDFFGNDDNGKKNREDLSKIKI